MSDSKDLFALKTIKKIILKSEYSLKHKANSLITEKEIGMLARKSRFLVRLVTAFQSDVSKFYKTFF